MTTPARVAAAAVIGVLAVGGTWLLLGRIDQPGVGVSVPSLPSPSSVVRSPSPASNPPASPGSSAATAPTNVIDLRAYTAGKHIATEFAIPFSFTSSTGWAWNDREAREYVLVPDARSPGSMSRAIYIWLDPIPAKDACGLQPAGIGHSVDAIARWLEDHPALETTHAAPVSIGGLSGLTIDFRKRSTKPGACFPDQVDVFILPGTADAGWNPSNDANNRLTLLDAGDGHIVAIDISSNDPTGFPDFLASAQPLVETFDFTP